MPNELSVFDRCVTEWTSGCCGLSSGVADALLVVVIVLGRSEILGAAGRRQTRFAACRPARRANDAAIVEIIWARPRKEWRGDVELVCRVQKENMNCLSDGEKCRVYDDKSYPDWPGVRSKIERPSR